MQLSWSPKVTTFCSCPSPSSPSARVMPRQRGSEPVSQSLLWPWMTADSPGLAFSLCFVFSPPVTSVSPIHFYKFCVVGSALNRARKHNLIAVVMIYIRSIIVNYKTQQWTDSILLILIPLMLKALRRESERERKKERERVRGRGKKQISKERYPWCTVSSPVVSPQQWKCTESCSSNSTE